MPGPAIFDLLEKEPEPSVRAVSGEQQPHGALSDERDVRIRRQHHIDEAAAAPYSHLLMYSFFFGKHVPDCDA
jgi:hypothetical protein